QLAGLTGKRAGDPGQSFEVPDSRLVALDYCSRLIALGEKLNPESLQVLHSLRQGLNHKAVVVAIHDQRRKKVALAGAQPQPARTRYNLPSEFFGSAQPRKPELAIYFHVFERDKPQRDLRG